MCLSVLACYEAARAEVFSFIVSSDSNRERWVQYSGLLSSYICMYTPTHTKKYQVFVFCMCEGTDSHAHLLTLPSTSPDPCQTYSSPQLLTN